MHQSEEDDFTKMQNNDQLNFLVPTERLENIGLTGSSPSLEKARKMLDNTDKARLEKKKWFIPVKEMIANHK